MLCPNCQMNWFLCSCGRRPRPDQGISEISMAIYMCPYCKRSGMFCTCNENYPYRCPRCGASYTQCSCD